MDIDYINKPRNVETGLGQLFGLRRRLVSGLLGVLCMAFGLLGACKDYPFAFRPNAGDEVEVINELAISSNNTDILFIIDNSGSMREEQENLIRNTSNFIETISNSENSFRIGFIVPDLNNDPGDNALCDSDELGCQAILANRIGGSVGHLVLKPATDLSSCGAGVAITCDPEGDVDGDTVVNALDPDIDGDSILNENDDDEDGDSIPNDEDRDTANCKPWFEAVPPLADGATAADVALREAQICQLQLDFQATVAYLGTGGTGYEQGLSTMLQALSLSEAEEGASDEFQSGFVRDEADLAVIIMSDEDDCSFTSAQFRDAELFNTSTGAGTCYTDADSAISTASFVNELLTLKRKGDDTTCAGEEATSEQCNGIGRVRAALIGGGVLGGEEGTAFIPAGCYNDPITSSAKADCACWSSAAKSFAGCPPSGATGNASNFFVSDSRFELHCRIQGADRGGCVSVDQSETGFEAIVYNDCSLDHPGFPSENVNASVCDYTLPGGDITPYCESLSPDRYSTFIDQIAEARRELGFPAGVFSDSICNPEYDQTLEQIARDVVLDSCFKFQDPVPVDTELVMIRSEIDVLTRETLSSRPLEECESVNGDGACLECTADNGNAVGWRFVDVDPETDTSSTLCLVCGEKKENSVLYQVQVLRSTGE